MCFRPADATGSAGSRSRRGRVGGCSGRGRGRKRARRCRGTSSGSGQYITASPGGGRFSAPSIVTSPEPISSRPPHLRPQDAPPSREPPRRRRRRRPADVGPHRQDRRVEAEVRDDRRATRRHVDVTRRSEPRRRVRRRCASELFPTFVNETNKPSLYTEISRARRRVRHGGGIGGGRGDRVPDRAALLRRGAARWTRAPARPRQTTRGELGATIETGIDAIGRRHRERPLLEVHQPAVLRARALRSVATASLNVDCDARSVGGRCAWRSPSPSR